MPTPDLPPTPTPQALTKLLHSRYLLDQPCTFLGPVLLSINPYCHHPHSLLEKVAERMYENVGKRGRQVLVVGGESGAGKTEAARVVMERLAGLQQGREELHRSILETNPLL